MTSVAKQIESALQERFAPSELKVIDDSAKHAGHAGAREAGESHFTVVITSAAFQGMARVARHRAVYDVLTPLFDEGLHALAIQAKAEGE
jgi:BolA protein